jgi:hypothetical protein
VATAGDIVRLIQGLCVSDAAKRALAAAVLFEHGSRAIRAVTQPWLAHAPLANLLERDPSTGTLKLTVGVAVAPETFEHILGRNGSPPLAQVPPDQDAREFELAFPGGARLDILTTREPGGRGAIARYLAKFGEGIQQVEIDVTDLDSASEVLRSKFALQPIYPATRAGANGTRVNFFLVPTEEGKVLIELVESPANPDRP